jgi:Ca-activated chloride channel family protein
MTFAHPERLWLVLAAVAAFALLYRALERRASARAFAYSNLAFALGALRASRAPGIALFGALVIGVAGLALAVTGPRLTTRVPVKDGTVVLCIDTSGSMLATDLTPSRAAAAKAAARTFVDEVPPGTRVGIVTFASGADVIVEPTADLDAVREAIDRIPPPNGGTAIGDALTLAGQRFPAQGKRVIVLMTDGVNNAGVDPVAAARAVAAQGIAIYTVGIGTAGSGELIPGTNEPADLDEDTLRAIAATGGGSYASATDAGSLRGAFRDLARATVWERRRIDSSALFAFGGGLTVLLAFLAGFWTGRFP